MLQGTQIEDPEEVLGLFDPVSRKKWLDLRPLLTPGFIDGAPGDVRENLRHFYTLYDEVKPLTRLRNQVYVSYKTLVNQVLAPTRQQ